MQPILLVVQFIIAIALIAVILLQRTAQDGGGLMGGGNTMGGLFTARGSANLLTRATAFLATLFILNSLLLGFIASRQHGGGNLIDRVAPLAAPASTSGAPPAEALPPAGSEKAPTVPKVPEVPLAK